MSTRCWVAISSSSGGVIEALSEDGRDMVRSMIALCGEESKNVYR
jgi:hypothetical protein